MRMSETIVCVTLGLGVFAATVGQLILPLWAKYQTLIAALH